MKDLPITMDEPASWMEKTGGYAKDMTLRDHFAAKAMQAMISSPQMPNPFDIKPVAEKAYVIASAMLKAREA